MVLALYSVGCYSHIRAKGFPRTSISDVALQFHASAFINGIFGAGVHKPYISMKKNFIFILTVLCTVWCYAQKQTYTGPFQLPGLANATTGKATYEYIEVDDERVYDGKFIYEHNDFRGSYKMNGTTKNNAFTGHWTFVGEGRPGADYSVSRVTLGDLRNVMVEPGVKTVMEGNLNAEGDREGKWTLTKTSGKYGYKGVAYFEEGLLCGTFEASATAFNHMSQVVQKYSLKGQFKKSVPGLPDSTWVGKWTDSSGIEYLMKMTFDVGRFVSLKVKNQSTGQDVSDEYNSLMFVNGKYARQYADDPIRFEDTQNLPDIFSRLLGIWLGSPAFFSEEPFVIGFGLNWSR